MKQKRNLNTLAPMIFLSIVLIVGILFGLMSGCKTQKQDESQATETPMPTQTPQQYKVGKMEPLSWELPRPERKEWSDYLFTLISNDFEAFDSGKDQTKFCPNWQNMTKDQKINAIGELFSAIALHESTWDPKARTFEKSMGYYSEGLFQISYVDKEWLPECPINEKDPKASILDPKNNIKCAVEIMKRQVKKTGLYYLPKSSSYIYWAVILEGGKYQQINTINSMVKKLKFCVGDK